MNTIAPDLSQELTTLVRTIDGVRYVYATRPLIETVASTVTRAVRGEPTQVHLVSVDESDAGASVLVSIGVDEHAAAPEVCRRVVQTVAAHLASRGIALSDIRVSVGSVG